MPNSIPSRIALNGVEYLTIPGWDRYSWLMAGFSTRRGGTSQVYAPNDMNLGYTAADSPECVAENRRLFAEALSGSPDTPLIPIRQIHSNITVLIGESGSICEGDGLLTAEHDELIAIQTADCIPVLVADPKHRAVAAFHAGWRGTVAQIVEQGIARMQSEFSSVPRDLIAAIGPGIGQCCYQVGDEVHARFSAQFRYAAELFTPDLHLDLTEANRRQLLDVGLKAENVQTIGACTSCHPELFFSHRAQQGNTGRLMAAIGIKGAEA